MIKSAKNHKTKKYEEDGKSMEGVWK